MLHDVSDGQYEMSAIGWRDTEMSGAMCGSPESSAVIAGQW
jgi:hypothetical protein